MKKKTLALILILALSAVLIAGCGGSKKAPTEKTDNNQTTKLVVGATAKPHAEILEVVKPLLAKEGIDLEIKVFTDYVQLNPALADGQIDA
ncbi:MAG: MetQ/NlpA family ABC transporter substrate-binding protein, partial [Methylocystaceae bacterium]